MINTKLYDESVAVVPPPPSKFTLNEWHLNNRVLYRTCLDQQQLADRILAECERGREQVGEITLRNKREVDHKLAENINDIEFYKTEILKQRKEVCIQLENLNIYSERFMNAMSFLKEQALNICQKCIIFREGRVGIDLCQDDVEKELLKEMEIIKGAQSLFVRALEQVNEQIRRLKSSTHFIDRDLEDKDAALKIDCNNLSLHETSVNLSMYHGFTPLDPANITVEENKKYTQRNIERAAEEVNSARCLRSYADTLLKQVIDDLCDQYHVVNEAFRHGIEETKEAKTKLEIQHSEITRQANEMSRNIIETQKKLSEKEGFMALAHTRLGNRAQRPGMELCRDLVETNLVNEVREIRENCGILQQILAEAQASLRYLLKTQIQLEEDINVKTNTFKIDEVDCMTLRQSMDYHAY